ncbi:MAG TPA: BTAD domain-containing putative transcriptional regulator [Acidimicrobiales bacterium]
MAIEYTRGMRTSASVIELATGSESSVVAVDERARRERCSSRIDDTDHITDRERSHGNDATVGGVLAHLDAAARFVLSAEYEEARDQTTAALISVGSLTGHLGTLTHAMHGVVRFCAGLVVDTVNDIAGPVSRIVEQSYPSAPSPEVAYVIGAGTVLTGSDELTNRWCDWTRCCADTVDERPLRAATALVQALVAQTSCNFSEARVLASEAAILADEVGLVDIAAHATSMSGYLSVILGDSDNPPELSALILPAALGSNPILKIEAQMTMALNELLAGRRTMTRTWLRSAMDSIPEIGAARSFTAFLAPLMGAMFLLTGSENDAYRLVHALEPALKVVACLSRTTELLQGLVESDLGPAVETLQGISDNSDRSPMIKAQAELCMGVRLAASLRSAESQSHFEHARRLFEAMGALGLAKVVEQELVRDVTILTLVQDTAVASDYECNPANRVDNEPWIGMTEWSISLLGGFTVWRNGVKVAFPQSRAAQTIKILAIRKKVSVDELVELLWPETEPGVGSRRLRNILWRIRTAFGELLEREGSFICLSSSASTDVARFEELASQALTLDCSPGDTFKLAEDAIAAYCGKLLPDDLYVDWTGSCRDSLSLLYVRVLEFLLARSLDEGDLSRSLTLLERLIEAEPFEETYYLQASEIYAQTGHIYRARSTLERANRMLNDLGVSPCPALARALNLSLD